MPRRRLSNAEFDRLYRKQWERTPQPRALARFFYEVGLSGVPAGEDGAEVTATVAERAEIARDGHPILMAVATRYGVPIDLLTTAMTTGSAMDEAIWCLRASGMDFDSIAIATNKNFFEAVDSCRRVEAMFSQITGLRADLDSIAKLPEMAQRRSEAMG